MKIGEFTPNLVGNWMKECPGELHNAWLLSAEIERNWQGNFGVNWRGYKVVTVNILGKLRVDAASIIPD